MATGKTSEGIAEGLPGLEGLGGGETSAETGMGTGTGTGIGMGMGMGTGTEGVETAVKTATGDWLQKSLRALKSATSGPQWCRLKGVLVSVVRWLLCVAVCFYVAAVQAYCRVCIHAYRYTCMNAAVPCVHA